MVLRSIGVLSTGKLLGIFYALLGLIFGGFFAVFSLAAGAGNMPQNGSAVPMAGLGVAAVIVMPIMYGFFGFIGGVISAALYNFVAGLVGGIEMEFERLHPVVPTTQQ